MSTPDNPLNKFRSYSYHHILIAADSTAVLSAIADASFPLTELHRTSKSRDNSDIQVKEVNDGRYVVIIDGFQDADFFIEDFSVENLMIPNPATGDATSMGVEAEMTIIEPMSARFLNHLNDVFSALNTDPTGITFILKTIFVGYPGADTDFDESQTVQYISSVKPLGMMVYDINPSFSSTGSEYKLSFVGTVNGASKLPQVQYSPISSINTSTGGEQPSPDTLENVLNRFMKRLNDEYTKEYEKAVQNTGTQYRKVEYKLTIDDAYKDSSYLVDDVPQQTSTYVNGGPMSFSYRNIERSLTEIMKKSKKVLKDAGTNQKEQNDTDHKYIFKVMSTINSSTDVMLVEYIIRQYKAPSTSKKKATEKENVQLSDRSAIEFDYIFTGQNVDIIDLDMNMELGLAFLMTVKPARNVPTSVEIIKGNKLTDTETISKTTNDSPNYSARANTPFFLSQRNTSNEVAHSTSSVDMVNFRAALNRHSMLSAIETKMKIRGNPMLLNDMIKTNDEIISGVSAASSIGSIAPDWDKTPGLVKVNIRMPSDTDGSGVAYEPFWYQGFYQLISVQNEFKGGEFTQVLDMMALPETNDDSNKSSEEPSDDSNAAVENRISEGDA